MNKRNVWPRLQIPAARRIALSTLVFAAFGAAHAGDLRGDAEAAAQVNFAEYLDLLYDGVELTDADPAMLAAVESQQSRLTAVTP